MNYGMSSWLLLASLVAPLDAQESKSHETPKKGLLELLNRDVDKPGLKGLGELRQQLRDLEEMMDRMREQFGDLEDLEGSSSSTSIRTGPDGVRVEIRSKDQDGEGKTEVFEAPDMETFKEKYPEVAQRFFLGGRGGVFQIDPQQLRFHRFDHPFGRFLTRTPDRDLFSIEPMRAREPSQGERLGVYISKLAPEVGAFLDLEPGQGLLVKEVTEDSLAEVLGIKAGDVVYEIDGVEVFSTKDIAKTLGAIDKGETVKVKVNRKGRSLELEAKKLEAVEKAELRKASKGA